ncbi:flagellar assembly protein FliH [bacterium]|nr:flagellar assembly protein FliH [bacterium]MBU1073044.1 flagellar assembly protein FliH [bacterium]MBU1674562.1 flagellar assembly protein FliH [bacterium]
MRQWSPDDLFDEAVAIAAAKDFVPAAETDIRTLDFVEDFPRDGMTSFLNRLEPHERDALYHMVDAEIRAEISRELARENERWRGQADAFLAKLAESLEGKIDEELTAVARNAVELSLAMAEQVTRRTIELDRGAVLRAIETIIFRAKRGTKFTVIAHPEDTHFLNHRPDELTSLNIVAVESDQRIERGGCVITSDGQEWDFTVDGRFEKLSEIVRESILDTIETREEPA